MNVLRNILPVLMTGAMLTGCGGSGSQHATASPTPQPQTGSYPERTDDPFDGYTPPAGAQYFEETDSSGSIIAQGFATQSQSGEPYPVGPYIAYHANGHKALEGYYDHRGVRTGWWHEWFANGQQSLEGYFRDGSLDTNQFWIIRNENGELLSGSASQ